MPELEIESLKLVGSRVAVHQRRSSANNFFLVRQSAPALTLRPTPFDSTNTKMNPVDARLTLDRTATEGGPVQTPALPILGTAGMKHEQLLTAEAAAERQRAKEAHDIYGRGKKIRTKTIRDKKLRGNLQALETKYRTATLKARDAEILLDNDAGFLEAEGDLERTFKTRQEDIRKAVPIEVAKKGFELKLDQLGPYKARYSRNGRDLLLAGHKGHIATLNWQDGKLGTELQLGETIRDATWLHNNQYFAVAQKKNTYIYDATGMELHQLAEHLEVTHLQFLPYHFLLVSAQISGNLRYLDTSTGQSVTNITTKMGGPPTAMTQNSSNAIIHLGHQNGTISLWSPTTTVPLVKMLPHRGPVRDIAIDREGRYMVSTGQDQQMAVWDIRMFKKLHNYQLPRPGVCVDISDRGLVSVGWGTTVEIWRGLFDKAQPKQEKVSRPYLRWGAQGQRVESVKWCPFEDVLGIGHDAGFSSALVPGAGEPNFDAFEQNPYETPTQRREAEVKSLLNKLKPGMISLDPDFVGNLDLVSSAQRQKEREEAGVVAKKQDAKKEKDRKRGRNTSLKRAIRRRAMKNVIYQ